MTSFFAEENQTTFEQEILENDNSYQSEKEGSSDMKIVTILDKNNSCKNISIIDEGTERPKLSIVVNAKEEFYFDPPESHYVKYIDEIYFSDLNGDGVDEVIVVCSLKEGNYGIYIIDTANHSYLIPPYINETDFTVGIEYHVYSVDENHIHIKGENFDNIVDLSFDEIWDWNYDPEITKENFFQPYQQKGAKIGGTNAVGLDSIETVNYNNQNCIKFREPLNCPWHWYGHLGYMEIIISWDSNGEYHIEKTEYIKQPLAIERKILKSDKPCQSISITRQGVNQPRILITVSDNEHFYLDPPPLQYPSSINELLFTDLNEDGVQEIIAECFLGGSYPGIYIIDIANRSYLIPPYTNDTDYTAGIKYTIYSVDENHIQIKGATYDNIIEILEDEVQDWSFFLDMTKEEYIQPYRETGKLIGHSEPVGFHGTEIISYNNRNCLKFSQILHGPWGRAECLGCMETIISWNANGEYTIENIEYYKEPSW